MFANDIVASGYEGKRIATETVSSNPVVKTVADRTSSIDELYERDARLLRGAAMLER